MAAALFNSLADPSLVEAVSAGTQPAQRVHPEVVAVMSEIGIDLSAVTPRKLTRALAGTVQYLVTMGCGEECPVVPGVRREDWSIPDPKGKPLGQVRAIREDIRTRVAAFIRREGWARRPRAAMS